MSRNKEEMEVLGSIDLVDNGASVSIENLDQDFADPVDVDEDPYIAPTVDDDGFEGFHPYAEASKTFEEQAGLEESPTAQENTEEEILGDELSARIRQREEAVEGSGGEELVMLQNADQAQKKALTSAAPYRNINPESAYNGLLGGRAVVPFGSPPIQVINWVGRDIEALPVTISIFPIGDGIALVDPAGISYAQNQIAYARITWGTRDGLQSVDVDVGTGVQLTVNASVVYVSVGNSLSEDGSPLTDTPASVAASIGFYTGSKDAPVIYTNYDLIGASPDTHVFKRPSYASHLYFERSDIRDAFTLTFRYSAGANSYVRAIAANAYLENPVKLSNDVKEVLVANNGTHTNEVRVMWGLYL